MYLVLSYLFCRLSSCLRTLRRKISFFSFFLQVVLMLTYTANFIAGRLAAYVHCDPPQVFRSGNLLLRQPSNSHYCVSLRQLAVALTINGLLDFFKIKCYTLFFFKNIFKRAHFPFCIKNSLLKKVGLTSLNNCYSLFFFSLMGPKTSLTLFRMI